ncbi:MAG: sensor histidine kinase [Oscillospiraceae bacterium]
MELLIIVVVLALLLIAAVLHLLALKHEMRQIKRELLKTRSKSYNRQLTIALFDRDLNDMAAEINRNLAYQKQLKLQAEQAEKKLKQSVSDIAHDLRTPLTVIKGNLRLIETGEQLSENGARQLGLCCRKTDEMKQIADDFFELSLLESDSAPVKLQPVNITNKIVQLLVDNEAVINAQGLTPEVKLPEHTVLVRADQQLLQRMLENLLNNALKYARGSFTAAVTEPAENRCRISFSNETNGILPDTERIFERTYRAEKSGKSSAGLGLYIVKLLAQKQNASVGAATEGNTLSLWIEFDTAERNR